MSPSTPDDKRHARRDAVHFERFCNVAGGSFAAIELFQQSTAPGMPDPYTAITLGAIGLLAVLGNDRTIISKNIADDPPRGDFRNVTRLRPMALRTELLATSPTAVVAHSAAHALFLGNIRLEASLRAAERALGAKEAEDHDSMEAREREADHWGYRAGERYFEFSASARRLARRLPADEQTRPLRLRPGQRVEPGATFEELFDVSTLAPGGIPIHLLRKEVRVVELGSTPVIAFSKALEQTANDSDAYAEYLLSDRDPNASWLEEE